MLELRTKRLIIRDPKQSDFKDWHRLMSDAKTMYYLDDIMTHSEQESQENLDAAIADIDNPKRTMYFLAIESADDGRFIGSIGYTVEEFLPVGNIAHVGYFILPEFHGRGYMTEAYSRLIDFAFEEGNIFRLKTACHANNEASERVMIKCGMIKEAHFKQCTWHDGQMKDKFYYRILKSEWQERRQNEDIQ